MPEDPAKQEPPFCPFQFKLLGPIPVPTITGPGLPDMGISNIRHTCDKADCAIWDAGQDACGLCLSGEVYDLRESLSGCADLVQSIIDTLRDGVEVKKQLLKFLKSEAKDVSKDGKE